ncbi:MAG: phytanoyl-CoA dioxygenase family protein [Caulobacterales bacterium]|nr:phytanoyl-CoA dioxygenase family protein [Caulobacterales bacterium]
MADPPATYGVTQRRSLADDLDLHVEELERIGYTVVPDALPSAVIDDLRIRIDRLAQDQAAGETVGPDADVLRCPLAADRAFLAAATAPAVLQVARRALGENLVLLQQNGIVNRPKARHVQARWHRDLPYQHFVGTQALAVNALLCIDDFHPDTGATLVLPGSHRHEAFPSDRFVADHQLGMVAPAGSVIMMDAMLYHCAGANISPRPRRAVNHLIGRPLLAQQIDIPRLLDGEFAEDPVLGPYLGYRWNPASDIAAWRNARS